MSSGHGFSLRADLMIQEYQETRRTTGAHGWDARLKLGLLVLVVGCNVGFANLYLSLVLFFTSVTLILWSRIPPKLFAIFFLAPAWATVLVFAGFSIGFGATPVRTIGPVTIYAEGMVLGAGAAARVASDMSWMALVFLTTSFSQLLDALRWFRVPEVIVDATGMAYRYAFLLADEFHRMVAAARTRGGWESFADRIRSVGAILAQVILRAYDRSVAIQDAMVSRGANAQSAVPEKTHEETAIAASSEGETLLATRQLKFAYLHGGKYEIDDVNLSVRRGEVVALCGPNGCGKSTLLKLCAGILKPQSGDVQLKGMTLDAELRHQAFRHVGLLFQDPNDQLFCTHVREDVSYGPKNMGLPPDEVERRVTEALDLAQVTYLAERPLHRLSFGEMKRVGLAGLLAMGPPLILLDEPSAYLDPAATEQLVTIIEHLSKEHGYTFVVVTHDMDIAARLATRVVILEAGRVVADGPTRSILTDEALLRKVRLKPPLLTQLFHQLQGHGFGPDVQVPMTLAEAIRLLSVAQQHEA